MRKALPILFTLLTLLSWNVFSQENTNESPTPDGVPIIDYNNPKPYIINDVKVYGVKYLDTELLAASTGLIKGEEIYIPGNGISKAVSRLWNQRYFSDVKVIAEILPEDRVNIEIYLQERPRVYTWEIEGVKKGEASTLKENMSLRRGMELSDYTIEKNIEYIKKFFAEKGFRNAEVTTRIENDDVIQNAVNVTFVVDKKERVRIGEITFDGNDEFTDKRLRQTMKGTHQVSANFFHSFKLNEDNYEDDKENIIDFYNSQGYRNAIIVRDSIYQINDKRIGINIQLEEGDKFYIRNISWVGNTHYPTEYLDALLGLQPGDIYDKKTLYKRLGIGKETDFEDVTQITALYQNEGFLMSVIEPIEVVVAKDSLDLEIKVFEGKQFTINNVDISGNLKVDDEVIRREIYTRPGELYNRSLIMQTLRQLAMMQHFDPMYIQPQIQPVSGNLVDIGWPLVEQSSDMVEISGGWGAGTFVGSLGLRLTNVSLRNTFKKGAWQPYPHGQNQQLSLRAQSNGSYYTSFMGSFTEPWLGGKKPNSLTVSAYYSSQTDSYYNRGEIVKGSSYFRTTGVAAGLGRRLSLPDPYFTIYNELGYMAYNLRDWPEFGFFSNGRANIVTLKTIFARSTINNPLYPSSGTEFSLSLTLTPPYSLFDGKDYANMDDSDQNKYKWIEYHKWQGSIQWFLPLTPDHKLTFMAKAEMGYRGYYNKHKESPFEGFDVGGDGMWGYYMYGVDLIGLRGYSDNSLTPKDYNNPYRKAALYNKYTLELRYPFLQQGMTMIYGLVFAEAGNAFFSWKDYDPFKLHRSLGVGIRLYMPYIGMIGLDWGYGFDGTATSPAPHGGKLHFSIGMQF